MKYIYVFGESGLGKSTFVQKFVDETVPKGPGGERITKESKVYDCKFDNQIRFVDSVGSGDNFPRNFHSGGDSIAYVAILPGHRPTSEKRDKEKLRVDPLYCFVSDRGNAFDSNIPKIQDFDLSAITFKEVPSFVNSVKQKKKNSVGAARKNGHGNGQSPPDNVFKTLFSRIKTDIQEPHKKAIATAFTDCKSIPFRKQKQVDLTLLKEKNDIDEYREYGERFMEGMLLVMKLPDFEHLKTNDHLAHVIDRWLNTDDGFRDHFSKLYRSAAGEHEETKGEAVSIISEEKKGDYVEALFGKCYMKHPDFLVSILAEVLLK